MCLECENFKGLGSTLVANDGKEKSCTSIAKPLPATAFGGGAKDLSGCVRPDE